MSEINWNELASDTTWTLPEDAGPFIFATKAQAAAIARNTYLFEYLSFN